MKDNIFSEPGKYAIPSLDLLHKEQKTDFAMRSLSYIYDKMEGKPDVPHRHAFYTVLWVKDGTGKHIIDYREHEWTAQRIFFVSPGQVHQVIADSRPNGMAIMFTCDFLTKNNISHDFITNLGLFSDLPDTPPLVTDAMTEAKMQLLIDQMEMVFDGSDALKSETIGAWLKLFLIECNKLVAVNASLNPQALQSGRAILFDFKQLVEKKFTQWHKVSDYASHLSISPDYLNNVIKSNIGNTAKEFIQNRIVIEAKRLGLVTSLSSKEIAFSLGFDDPAHFSKFFKNATGTAFSDFRSELQKQIGVSAVM
jgi:AraC family transcriptional regulator, transcriptional activator of pobA